MKRMSYCSILEYIKSNTNTQLVTTEKEYYENHMSSHNKFTFKCECGNVFTRRLDLFKSKKQYKCNSCIKEQKKNNMTLWTRQAIEDYINNNTNCELIDIIYKRSKSLLTLKCECGNNFKTTFEKVRFRNKIQCNDCSGRKSHTIKDVKRYIEENSECKLLSTEYKTVDDKLELKCKCGNNFKTTFYNFRKGKMCCNNCTNEIMSIKSGFDINYIKDFIKNNSECELISTTYINAREKLKFRCKCGKIFETTFDKFRAGKRRCNVCSKKTSRGEYKTIMYLEKKKIEYKEQYKFKNCRDKKPLPFDFYLPKLNICIEIDGEGHYEPFRFSKDKNENIQHFVNTKKHDKIKQDFCMTNNIKLIRIPYWKFDNIDKCLEECLIS